MSSTEELLNQVNDRVEKAIFESSDMSTAGKLNDEQADRFIDLIHNYAVVWQDARVIRMRAPKRKIEKLGFNSRILVDPDAQGATVTSSKIKEPTTSKVELSSVEVAALVDIGFDALEDNIEREGLENHIVDLVTTRIAADLEEFYLYGDTGSGDSFLALNDGWFKLITTNIHDQASAGFTEDSVFGAMLDKVPDKYGRNLNEWRFYVPPKLERSVRRERAERQTGGGDTWLTSNSPMDYAGVPITPAPYLLSTASALGNVLLVHPKNLLVGIQRDITFDNFRNGRQRVYQMTWTMRTDCQIEFEDAAVKAINVVS